MQLRIRPYDLLFHSPFGVSSNTRVSTPSVFVSLASEALTGYGEACLPPYLGETVAESVAFLERARMILDRTGISSDFTVVLKEIDELQAGCNAAKAAIDIALYDLHAKHAQKPLWDFLGLTKPGPLYTSYTIGICGEEELDARIRDAVQYSILKIKAGTTDDIAWLSSIRKRSQKPLYVDANQGWKNTETAAAICAYLEEENCQLIEQPFPVQEVRQNVLLREATEIPLIADESVRRLEDMQRLHNSFGGINIKLMKSTGIHEALKMIELARSFDLKVMAGCMAESSCASSAMAHLAGLADFVDLDAPLLYLNDPFRGISYRNGEVILPDAPGTGAIPSEGFFDRS